MNTRCTGFTLAELLVGLVFLAVVLGPFLLFVSHIQDLNSAIGEQGRTEAWRSFNDQVVAAGIDPGLAPALSPAKNAAVPPVSPARVRQVTGTPLSGVPAIVALQVVSSDSMPEPRLVSAGFQLGAGAAVAPIAPPVPPLPPVVMPPPAVSPADGTVVDIVALVPAAPGDPFTFAITCASTAGNRVCARTNTSLATHQGLGSVLLNVTVVDLLTGVTGSAWTEYPGNAERGDRAVPLDDGRTRWLITTADGRVQTYEPSAFVPFAYRVDIGTPVLVRGTDEVPSGSSVSFDYAEYNGIQNGTTVLHIDYPQATRNAFGRAWDAQALGFNCRFGGAAGPFSGSLTVFFQPETLSLWADTVAVTAFGVVPSAAVSGSATWTVVRTKTPLGTPLVSTPADGVGFYSPGGVAFHAPLAADGSAIGRLSFENGTYLSTGTNLSITLIP